MKKRLTKPLRHWQQAAHAIRQNHHAKTFTVEATPGAGKTTYAAHESLCELHNRTISRIVVVTFTKHLKKQWALSMNEWGTALNHHYNARQQMETGDYKGIVTTYAQVARNAARFAAQCRQRRTMVIFDEIHHCGETKAWGDGILKAFGNAVRVLSLTGTPIRTDNNAIPFLNYADNKVVPDYSYSYGDGLLDGVTRPVAFIPYSGEISWSENGVDVYSLLESFKTKKMGQRAFSVALNPDVGFLDKLVRDADEMLTKVRRHELIDAGGFIVAKSKTHALEVSALVKRITGELPAVVVSDDEAANSTVEAYANSTKRWLVAVKMVSEGIDIPRLRVGVYASTVMTQIHFRQWVGRFVRTRYGVQPSYLFVPAYAPLLEMAREIEAERRHVLRDIKAGLPSADTEAQERETNFFEIAAGEAVNHGASGVMVRGQTYQLGLFGGAVEVGVVAETVDAALGGVATVAPTMTETIANTRKSVSRAVNRLARKRRCEQREVYGMLNRQQRIKQADCSLVQLQERLAILARWENG